MIYQHAPTVTVKTLSSYHLYIILMESIREVTKTIHKITIMLKSNEDNSMYSN